jgi:ergothioneine biosynthesis protein EgtB
MDEGQLQQRFSDVRSQTRALSEPLGPEDACAQSMPDASPAKWHLAHTSWFFETFVLEAAQPGYRLYHPHYRTLFNSYYNSVGDQYPRPQRGLLTRPSLDDVLGYRSHVDEHVHKLFKNESVEAPLAFVIDLGLHHEQQHQELLLTDVKHLFSHNPLDPAYARTPEAPAAEPGSLAWHGFPADTIWVGHDGGGFAFDNESPRHRVFSDAFEIASRPVTNGEYRAFVEDDGYARPELWLSDGWTAVSERGWQAPLYWRRQDGRWRTLSLGGVRDVRDDEPVCHVSLYEADAYARWADARLPTEAEWERTAAGAALEGNFASSRLLHPAPAPAASAGPAQLFGDVWEWTASGYQPYPGYRPSAGALGEYNGKFMANQMVLRGGSCATPTGHIRPSYRNFFYPDARWQFSGIRLARDIS